MWGGGGGRQGVAVCRRCHKGRGWGWGRGGGCDKGREWGFGEGAGDAIKEGVGIKKRRTRGTRACSVDV